MKLQVGVNGLPEYTGALRGDAVMWKKRSLSDKDAHRLLMHRIQGPDTDTSNGRIGFARQWNLNYAFVFGHQSYRHAFASLARDFERFLPPEPTYTANHILPKVLRQVSKLTSARIDWRVPPNTTSIDDQKAALVGQKALVSMHHELGVEGVRKEAVGWSVINGNGFVRVGWKPFAKIKAQTYTDPVTKRKYRKDELSAAARHRLTSAGLEEDSFEGMPYVEALGSLNVTVPILASGTLIESAPWLVTSTRMHVSEAANRWGRDIIDKLEPDTHAERLWDHYQRSWKTMVLHGGGGISHLQDREQEELVTIHEMWEPPSIIRPDGVHIVATRNEWLVVDKYKPGARRYPVAKIDYASLPGRFWSKGMVEELIMPQRSKNRGRSDAEMIRDRLARPKVWIPTNSGVTPDQFSSGDIPILQGRASAGPPQYITASGAGDHQTINIVDQQTEHDMNTASFQGEITQGQGASGVRSAEQADQLLEQDAQALGSPVSSQELAMRDVGSMILFEIQQHFTEPRLIRLYGEDKQSDVMSFSSEMLRGHTEVHISEGSLLPRSPSIERARLIEGVQMGLIPPSPQTLELYIKTSRIQNADSLMQPYVLEQRRAEQENQMFESDDPSVGMPMVEEFDDHAIHAAKHKEFLNSDRYEIMTLEAPVLARTAVAHYQRHLQLLQKAMMAQMQMEAATRGGPGEKGTPSPPKQSADRGGGRAA